MAGHEIVQDSPLLTLKEADIAAQKGIPGKAGYELGFTPGATDALLVIDLQNGFMPGGALEVPEGTETIPLVNAMVDKFEVIIMSQDWHPDGHSSFASQHEGKKPYDEVEAPYGPQTLWPDHCVMGTKGQGFFVGVGSHDCFFPMCSLVLFFFFFPFWARPLGLGFAVFCVPCPHSTPPHLTRDLKRKAARVLFTPLLSIVHAS